MNEDISNRFRWTADEIRNAQRWHFRHRVRPVFRWAFVVLSAAFIVVGASQLWQSPSWFPGGVLLFAGTYIPVMFLVVVPWRIRRQFARRPDRDTEIEWRISADSIHVRSALGKSEFTWAALVKVVQTPAGFLFYPNEQIFHWLPRHGFASDADFDRLSQLGQQHATAFHRNT